MPLTKQRFENYIERLHDLDKVVTANELAHAYYNRDAATFKALVQEYHDTYATADSVTKMNESNKETFKIMSKLLSRLND